ncbi:MAG: efflux RND transporter periplasmic adaptor subunit [Myxococcales bacterium]|nr:efflux RND transporter periplasmic adaptor subunit [Myxococcota bacterium]MDW8282083.1 efflux RND transporter periplasmic adaptor subunit [Myxococcales bacterium]
MTDSLSSDLASLRLPRDEEPRRGGAWRKLAVAALLGTGGGVVYLVGGRHVEASLFRAEVRVTEIALVSPAQGFIELTSTGYVVPLRSAKVGARVQGRLARVLVREGEQVRAGQVLAVLDDSNERSAIRTARARVEAARARAATARANLAEAEMRASREQTLVQRGAAAAANAEDQAARVKALAEAQQSAEAEVRAAEAEVRALEVAARQLTIVAPIDGTVVTRPLQPGELVGPAGAPILELADFSSLVVETDVPEARLSRVRPGAPCEIVLDAYPSRRFRGEAMEIIPHVNRAKATVPVRVKFVDAPTGVLPDMSARVSFLQQALDAQAMQQPPRLVVPAAAVAERGGARVVFVIEGDRVRMTPVELGGAFGSGFELKSGPPAGTRVVRDPDPSLSDGRKIKERND